MDTFPMTFESELGRRYTFQTEEEFLTEMTRCKSAVRGNVDGRKYYEFTPYELDPKFTGALISWFRV
jgi:hypothetical protein